MSAKLNLARDLVRAMQKEEEIHRRFDQTQGIIKENAPKEFAEKLLKRVVLNDKKMPELLENLARVYAGVFSEAQLQGLLHFYRSDLGQALIENMPILEHQSNEVMKRFL